MSEIRLKRENSVKKSPILVISPISGMSRIFSQGLISVQYTRLELWSNNKLLSLSNGQKIVSKCNIITGVIYLCFEVYCNYTVFGKASYLFILYKHFDYQGLRVFIYEYLVAKFQRILSLLVHIHIWYMYIQIRTVT